MDKLDHFLACLFISGIVYSFIRYFFDKIACFLLILLVVSIAGFGKEFYDYFYSHGDFSSLDLVADYFGYICFILLAF